MKGFFILALFLHFCIFSNAQNTFPATGFVGIGTNIPAGMLEIAHNGAGQYGTALQIKTTAGLDGPRASFEAFNGGNPKRWNIGMRFQGTSFGLFEDGYIGSFGTERLTILPGGNVGIGTGTPLNKLHIYTTTSTDGLSVDGTTFPSITFRSNGAVKGYTGVVTTAGGYFNNSSVGDIVFRNEANKLLFGSGSNNSTMTISGDNVGIGTTVPATKLDVAVANLGTAAGNYLPLTRLIGSGPSNTFMINDFVYRESAGNEWTSTSYIRGISVDNSFLIPGASLKSWIKQKPTDNRIEFGSDANTYMSIVGGNVGIGITNPSSWGKLTVAGNIVFSNNLTNYTISGPVNGGAIRIKSDMAASDRYIQLGQVDNNQVFYPSLTVVDGGNIGIGTLTPGNYKLAVKGDAIFTKVQVKASASSWPDYVFNTDYKLNSLSDVEAYIKKYNHLPEVPSAQDVEKEGNDIGATQAVLLKKIEELTLYVIELNNKNQKLESKVKQLEAKNRKGNL